MTLKTTKNFKTPLQFASPRMGSSGEVELNRNKTVIYFSTLTASPNPSTGSSVAGASPGQLFGA